MKLWLVTMREDTEEILLEKKYLGVFESEEKAVNFIHRDSENLMLLQDEEQDHLQIYRMIEVQGNGFTRTYYVNPVEYYKG